jgi:pilus assembly protein CpaF
MAIFVRIESIKQDSAQGSPLSQSFEKDEITIGRLPINDLVLAEPDVSGRHAKLSFQVSADGRQEFVLTDTGSSNGTFIEDLKLEPHVDTTLRANQRIIIGSFIVTPVLGDTSRADAQHRDGGFHKKAARDEEKEEKNRLLRAAEALGRKAELFEQEIRIKHVIHDNLIERLDLRRKDIVALSDEDLRQRAQSVVERILVDLRWDIPSGLDRDRLLKQILDEALGLGPLEELLMDDSVSEVMVNNYLQIYAERGGRIELTDLRFSSEEAVLAAVERIIAPIGRRIDESSPIVDARLKDGSRVNAVIRPLALKGPCITIRKFARDPLTIDDLVRFGSLSEGMAEFL